MLRYGLTVKEFKSDGHPRSSNKRKTVMKQKISMRSLGDREFQQKELLISFCEIFSPIFFAFSITS